MTSGPEYVEVPITLQAKTSQAIVVTGMTLNVTSSKAVPSHGSVVKATGCGGGMEERIFDATPPSTPSSVQPQIVSGKADGVGFPYKVTSGDPEQLSVRLNPVDRDILFTITITWISDGEIKRTTIDDNGIGYHVMGSGNLPVFSTGDLYN
ncbi:hypothetical protein [Streptomyces sp. NRRL F-525]|uniref:hypothetical protein n=1 Tax=Streptomyces sp. NRRL F-525 TaxID=1463861 RepID=UPI00131ACDE8|nr:hypothetical protein [Streptomyces sp. NRRL F-525]